MWGKSSFRIEIRDEKKSRISIGTYHIRKFPMRHTTCHSGFLFTHLSDFGRNFFVWNFRVCSSWWCNKIEIIFGKHNAHLTLFSHIWCAFLNWTWRFWKLLFWNHMMQCPSKVHIWVWKWIASKNRFSETKTGLCATQRISNRTSQGEAGLESFVKRKTG